MDEPTDTPREDALRRLEAEMLDRAYLYDHQPTYREAVHDVFAALRSSRQREVEAA